MMNRYLITLCMLTFATGLSVAYYLEVKDRSHLDQKLVVTFLVFSFLFLACIEFITNLIALCKSRGRSQHPKSSSFEIISTELLLALVVVIYLFLIWITGFLIGTGIGFALFMYVLRVRKIFNLIMYPLCCVFAIYLIFQRFLAVTFPSPMLSRIIRDFFSGI